jgi:hypothetical protein
MRKGGPMRYIYVRALVRLCLSLLLLSVPGLAAAETIELMREHGVFMVPVRINDAITIPFVLDSGAGDVSVPEDVFKTLLRTRTVTESDFREPGGTSRRTGRDICCNGSSCTRCASAIASSKTSLQVWRLTKPTRCSAKASLGGCLGGQSIIRGTLS